MRIFTGQDPDPRHVPQTISTREWARYSRGALRALLSDNPNCDRLAANWDDQERNKRQS